MKNELEKFLLKAFKNLGFEEYLSISESEKADYQINSVFKIAKEKKENPLVIGEKIVDEIKKLDDIDNYIKSIEFVMPGFININISDKLINSFIKHAIKNGFIEKTNSSEIYFLDYGGPNIAKPLHIGHLRPAIIGESFKRILNAKGYKTISDVHLGDFGLQIGEVIYGIKMENKNIDDIDIEYLNYIYPHMSKMCKEDEEVLKACQKVTFDFQNGDEEYIKLFKKIKEVSLNDIKRLYNYLDVDFDLWQGESDSKNYFDKLFDKLNEYNLIEEDQGETIVRVKTEEDNKEMPPVKIKNKEGAVGYATTDLATILEREEKYQPNHILYFTDARQALHFEGVFRVAKMMGIKANLIHYPFGTINGSDGKPFKTRSGETLKLDELINETREIFLNKREENKNMNTEDLDKQINAIIKYADLQNNREKSYNFDIAKFSDVSGKTGPYILYSAIRLRKILEANQIDENITDNIYNEIDRKLRIKLLEINKVLDKSIESGLPSVVAEYLYDLCNIVNSFYQNINISKEENREIKNDYLNVLKLAFNIIESCLNMLIIKIPSEM